jgi:hypothetical protein
VVVKLGIWARGLQLLTEKDHLVTKCHTGPWIRLDSSEELRQWEMEMIFEIWNIRSLYWVGSLITIAYQLTKHNVDIVAIQEVRWDKLGSVPAEDFYFCGNGNANHHLGIRFLTYIYV